MSIEQFIDNEVKSNDRACVIEGHAAVSAVRIFRPGGPDPRYVGVGLQGPERARIPPTCGTASRPIPTRPTIPQLYVKGEFVGGCDIIREMFQAGKLAAVACRQGRHRHCFG